jgi:hypothetical protein
MNTDKKKAETARALSVFIRVHLWLISLRFLLRASASLRLKFVCCRTATCGIWGLSSLCTLRYNDPAASHAQPTISLFDARIFADRFLAG